MALVLRPHSATYKAPAVVSATVGTTAGVIIGASHPSTTATILGQLDEITTKEAFERWGIEEERAGVWMCNPADGDSIVQEGKLTIDDSTWIVRAKKRINHGLLLDHWEILVARQ